MGDHLTRSTGVPSLSSDHCIGTGGDHRMHTVRYSGLPVGTSAGRAIVFPLVIPPQRTFSEIIEYHGMHFVGPRSVSRSLFCIRAPARLPMGVPHPSFFGMTQQPNAFPGSADVRFPHDILV